MVSKYEKKYSRIEDYLDKKISSEMFDILYKKWVLESNLKEGDKRLKILDILDRDS